MSDKSKYEQVPNAVALCERLRQWDMYRETAKVRGIEFLREIMRATIIACLNKVAALKDSQRQIIFQRALDEWDNPQLLEYLRSKVSEVTNAD